MTKLEIPIREKIRWTIHDVVAMTGMAERTIRKRVAQGRFPEPIHDGGLTTWIPRKVLAWADPRRPKETKRKT